MKPLLVLLAGLAVAACAVDSAPAPAPSQEASAVGGGLPPLGGAQSVDDAPVQAPITGNCGMERLQHYVGQPRTSVPRNAMPDQYRVVGPNTVVTMEYIRTRLTVRVDENDVVESMSCG